MNYANENYIVAFAYSGYLEIIKRGKGDHRIKAFKVNVIIMYSHVYFQWCNRHRFGVNATPKGFQDLDVPMGPLGSFQGTICTVFEVKSDLASQYSTVIRMFYVSCPLVMICKFLCRFGE